MSYICNTCGKGYDSKHRTTHRCIALMTDHERFAIRVVCDVKTRCWVWTGAVNRTNSGYLRTSFWVSGKMITAPRYAWEQAHGQPIPDGLQALHVLACSNSLCVRPAHLYVGTHLDNMGDRWMAGGYAKRP